MNIDTAMNCLWAEVARYNEDSRVREAWQTLKTAVSEQRTASPKFPPLTKWFLFASRFGFTPKQCLYIWEWWERQLRAND